MNDPNGAANEDVESPVINPHESVSNDSVNETVHSERTTFEPIIAEGFVGKASEGVAPTLNGTGLEQIARRVLAKRGIEVSNLSGLRESIKSQSVKGRPRRDVVEASSRFAKTARPIIPPNALRTEAILGNHDERQRIFDTSQYPYSAIASLEITAKDGSGWLGTGWFVSPRVLVTAGHCVYIQEAEASEANGWVHSIRVVPGRNGTGLGSEPFGAVTTSTFRSVTGWINGGDDSPEHDYGAIILPTSNPLGSQVGAFDIGVFSDNDLLGLSLNVAGYPADKGDPSRDPTTNPAEEETLWYDVKQTAHVTENKVFYDIDTYGGQSGSPVYIANDDRRIAVAIHAYGPSGDEQSNSGTRINKDVFDVIQGWKTTFTG